MLTEIANAANVHPACRSYVDASFCRQKRVPTQTGSHRGLWIIWSLSWDISKTLQLTRKQSWRINSATGVRENMYVGLRLLLSKHSRFFGHSRNHSSNLSATKAKIKPCVSSCRMSGPEDGQQERFNARRCWRWTEARSDDRASGGNEWWTRRREGWERNSCLYEPSQMFRLCYDYCVEKNLLSGFSGNRAETVAFV